MSELEVSEALYNLRHEIDQLSDSHPEFQERLEIILDELEDTLESNEDENHLHLVEDIKEAISQFEVERPTLTGVVNALIVALSNMGI